LIEIHKAYGGTDQSREKKAYGFFPNKRPPHELSKQTGKINGYDQLLPEQSHKTYVLQEMPLLVTCEGSASSIS